MRPKTSTGKILLLLSWILTSLSSLVHAQTQYIPVDPVSIDLGVITVIGSVLQDKTGFIWVATFSGLYKYDGYKCVVYRHEPGDSTSLVDNRLSALCEDNAGVLWVGSWMGIEKFDRVHGTFRHFTPNPLEIDSHEGNYVYRIFEDRTGKLWVGGLHGLYIFDRSTEKFTTIQHEADPTDDITHSAVLVIYEDKEGGVWLGTRAGLQKYDSEAGKFKHQLSEVDYEVLSIFEDEAGTLWLATSLGLKAYNPKKRTCETYLPDPGAIANWLTTGNHVRSIRPDIRPNILWIGTGQGLFTFDMRSKTFIRWTRGHTDHLCVDRSGTLMFGTDRGVQKFSLIRAPFMEYSTGESPVSAGVLGREGTLWVFCAGWRKFDLVAGRFVPFSFGDDQLCYVYPREQGGHMAFFTKDGRFCIRDSLGRQTFSLDRRWEKLSSILACGCKTSKGYYVGTHQGGFYLFDPRNNGVSELCNLKQAILYIIQDRRGLLWISTVMGRLVRYDEDQGTVAEFVHDGQDSSSWCGKPVNWMYEDSKGEIWIATDSGLDRYDYATNHFIHFTEKSGLLGDNVRGVAEDDHGCLWISTTRGISRWSPETGGFKCYDASYGFTPAVDGFLGGVAKDDNGQMYVGGARGMIRFHPDSLHDNRFVPPVVITSFSIFDKPNPVSNTIRLAHDQNFISFEFAALSYISPERNQYAYRMEGVDKDWVYSGTRRYVNYANLDPGKYVFRVKGSNNEGVVWNEAGTSVSIVITPPWWKTSWAYGFYVLAIVATLYTTWRLQMRRVKIRHALEMTRFEATKLHEVDELKSRFFANISHEFRTPLTLILGPIKQLSDESENEKTRSTLGLVQRNARKLLNLVNELLDLSKLESGNMKLQTTLQNVVPLMKGLLQSFCSYAERKKIDLNFQSTQEEIPVYIDEDKMEKIFTNLLSNAFKFTPEGGAIDVAVKLTSPSPLSSKRGGSEGSEFVVISVSDTGIGIPADKISQVFDRFYQVDGSRTREQEGTGIGLSLTKELVELHKGTIEVESEEGRGTTFTVRLPLGKGHLGPEEILGMESETAKFSLPELRTREEGTESIRSPGNLPTGKGKPIVLIVEDNADVRAYVRSNLTEEWRILEARDGEEGWSRTIEQLPDLIVSDVMMPSLDGFQLCNRLKSDERTSHIPLILLTAKAASQDKVEGFETGADDYIMKPFEPAELRARIKNLLEQRNRLHEHFRKHGLFELEEEKITPVDQRFLEKILAIIGEHISDVTFGVEALAECMAVSRSLLLKKLEALTGESPVVLIKRVRLEKAAKLIEGGFGNVTEVALEVGFNNPSYFAECFKKQFGVGPKYYQRKFT